MDVLNKVENVYDKWENHHATSTWKNREKDRNGYSSKHSANGNGYRYRQPRNIWDSNEPRKARYRQKLEKESQQLGTGAAVKGFVPSLGFDLSSSNHTYAYRCLGVHGSCSKCLPSSKFVNSDQSGAPLVDILHLPHYTYRGTLFSICPTLTWTITRPPVHPLVDVRGPAKVSPRINTAIEESAQAIATQTGQDIQSARKYQKNRANHILTNISGQFHTSWVLKLSNYIMHWTLGRLFKQLYVQGSHIDMLLEAQKSGLPMVFLPSHKSHLDYLLLSFVMLNIGIKMPHVAAGDNLNIPFFSWLIRHHGGWFIRRKLDNGSGKDELYRSCLHEFLEQLLKANQTVEFYIEGSRSRTGKPTLPKGGLLSLLVESIREGVVPDILIVPLTVSYDRVLEQNFIRHELLGGNKKPENFLKAMKGVWSMLTNNVGSVRMDFTQPFSLKDYLYTYHISRHSLMDMSLPQTVTNGTYTVTTVADRRLVNALGYHIIYDINCSTPLMSTHIVGFLLLTKHREGVVMTDLIASYEWIVNKITNYGRCIGYSGSPSEAVHYSLVYLNHLIVTKKIPSKKDNTTVTFVQPRLQLPDVFELLHHVNHVSNCFVRDAFIACSIAVLLEETCNLKDTTNPLHISSTELSDQALNIAKIFSREFIYSPPCVDISTCLYEGIESLRRMEIIRDVRIQNSLFMHKRTEISWDDTWDVDTDDDTDCDQLIEVSRLIESRDHLRFLQTIMGPFIEGYWNCAMYLCSLNGNHELIHLNESSFIDQLQQIMIEKATNNSLYFIESCSSDILRNSLCSYVRMGVVCINEDSGLSISSKDELSKIIHTLSICKL